ncbi:MAG: DUF6636 domain-containing protein [Gaiellaceae bacterium]
MRRGTILVGLLVVAIAVAVGTGAQARGSVYVTFRMPSGNIACGYSTGFGPVTLRCDILSGLKPEPRRPCELDWTGLSMGRGTATPTCAGDTVYDRKAPVLKHGSVWKRGPFTCVSLLIGLSCTNRTGHGFFLSKERWVAG